MAVGGIVGANQCNVTIETSIFEACRAYDGIALLSGQDSNIKVIGSTFRNYRTVYTTKLFIRWHNYFTLMKCALQLFIIALSLTTMLQFCLVKHGYYHYLWKFEYYFMLLYEQLLWSNTNTRR